MSCIHDFKHFYEKDRRKTSEKEIESAFLQFVKKLELIMNYALNGFTEIDITNCVFFN